MGDEHTAPPREEGQRTPVGSCSFERITSTGRREIVILGDREEFHQIVKGARKKLSTLREGGS